MLGSPAVKRLIWLLIFAFGTALAQVSPVDVRLVPAEQCNCCERPGACGMPDCGQPPASARPVFQLSSPAQVARVVTKRIARTPAVVREKFYVQFLPRVSVVPARPVSLAVASPASVSLFKEHCSFLI